MSMSVDEKLEMIDLHKRVSDLETKVFKWKRRRVWLIDNYEVWVPMVIFACMFFYMGFLVGDLWNLKPR
jgi:hypothetical protein